jgi:hypothetical protein
MHNLSLHRSIRALGIALLATTAASAQNKPMPSPAEAVTGQFTRIHNRVLDMAKDFPADKYEFQPTKDMRSFREVVVHIMGGPILAAKAVRGEKPQWVEQDAKNFPDKSAVVAFVEKVNAELAAALKANPGAAEKLIPLFVGITGHSTEHYGLLPVYYRMNQLVPPQSRPKGGM